MKIKVTALKPHMRHAIGEEYLLPKREAKVLEGLGYVAMAAVEPHKGADSDDDEVQKKRTYKRRDMKAE